MNKEIGKYLMIAGILLCSLSCSAIQNVELDKNNIRIVNREFIPTKDYESNIISLNAQKSSGLAIINNVEFETGIIEFDVLGENNPGRSFVGIAFNIQNDSTYEAIYFRPFNFKSSEKIRREHSMQYIFHPDFTWKRLRTEKEGQFESEFFNPPSPDDWFSIRVKINSERVIIEDQSSGERLMEVERLSSTNSNKIGFWTGFGSKGSFRNLRIENK